ncbi:ribosomal protein S5 domain 2-like protein, partial [Caulochytrium protostelioides]
SNAETAFIRTAAAQGLRLDGRAPTAFRPLKFHFASTPGAVEVHLGAADAAAGNSTKVQAVVSAELGRPAILAPNEGVLAIALELAPDFSAAQASVHRNEEEASVSRLLERALRRSGAVDLESLSVIAGEVAWHVRIDIRVLDAGGNILDAACVAALAALLHFRRPDVGVEHTPSTDFLPSAGAAADAATAALAASGGPSVRVYGPDERPPVPLTMHHLPVCVTFAFFNDGHDVVLDPTRGEEIAASPATPDSMAFVLNANGELCALRKDGGCAMDLKRVLQCGRLAALKAADLTKAIKDAV